jgi:antitoxin component of MazEF toxin-antitoxin module
MTEYIIEVQEDEDNNFFVELPDDVIDELGWEEGDLLNWDIHGEGIVLTKVNDRSDYELLDE